MDEQMFAQYLKGTGRKLTVINRYIKITNSFEDYLKSLIKPIHDINDASPLNLEDYTDFYEQQTKKSARTVLYAIMHYYKSVSNTSMASKAQELREPRKIKRGPYPLKEFLGINPGDLNKLADIGIKNVDQMRTVGRTSNMRSEIAKKTGISSKQILELVQLSDLERVGYVKQKFTRLFYNAGIRSPGDLKKWNSDDLYDHLGAYITKSGWDGIVPYKSDLRNYIESAKKLPKMIDYEN
jgi:hypothetical protein